MNANISQERIEKIAAIVGADGLPIGIDAAREIIDPGYTYWSQRGDTSREEHFAYLENSSDEEIAAWVRSIWRDISS